MPSPTSSFASGRAPRLVDRIDEQLRRALADALERDEPLDGERVDVGGVVEETRLDELRDALLAQALDVHRRAAGEEHDALHALRRAVDVDAPRVGLALEAHERLVAHRAVRGELPLARARLRFASTGPTTSGITSPALRTMTVSPTRTSLRATSSWLCSVASPTVEPPTNTGSSCANGVARPVRPMLTMIPRSSVVFSSGGNLNAIAQRGARLVKPSSLRCARSSTFTTAPSMS